MLTEEVHSLQVFTQSQRESVEAFFSQVFFLALTRAPWPVLV